MKTSMLMIPPTKKELLQIFEGLTLVTLKPMIQFFAGKDVFKRISTKEKFVSFFADFLMNFNKERLDLFLAQQPLWIKEAIYRGTFEIFVNYTELEKKYGVRLKKEKSYSYYNEPDSLDVAKEPGLSLFVVLQSGFCWMHEIFRRIFFQYLDKPEGYVYAGGEKEPATFWSNESFILENGSLLIRVCEEIYTENSEKTIVEWLKKGLKKETIRKMRSLSGQPEFPIGSTLGLDPIELFFRWYLPFRKELKFQENDMLAMIQQVLSLFFPPQGKQATASIEMGSLFEFLVLAEHLSLRRINDGDFPLSIPQCRFLFFEVFTECARNGGWYSVERLYRSLFLQGYRFSFADPYIEQYALHKIAQGIVIEGDKIIESNYTGSIYVWGPQAHRLLYLPLFKGYWYLLALLGLVEIVEEIPEPSLISGQGNTRKVCSVYDGLSMVRVTKLGQYCLGLLQSYQIPDRGTYEVLADKDLLLITFRGASLERKLFLSQIAEPLGNERYRVTEDSFVRGCKNFKEVEKRITTFKRLIEPEPSERWQRFFKGLRDRATLLSRSETAMVFDVSEKVEIARLLLQNKKLRHLCYLAEDNRIVVLFRDRQKFLQIAESEGFFTGLSE